MMQPGIGFPASTGAAAADTALEGQNLDMDKLQRLGGQLASRFVRYESERRVQELKWMRNLRQWLGEYDPDIQSQLGPNRSRAYPKLTRVKVISMVSRLMNMLFPVSERNWGIEPSPVPNLPAEVLAQVADEVLAAMDGATMDPATIDAALEKAIRAVAKQRAAALELEIDDYLRELGGSEQLPYVALVREVLFSGVLYGLGVLKGPFVRAERRSRWRRDPATGQIKVTEEEVYRPQFEHVSVWDYYPDMSAKKFSDIDGQFERHVMSREQLSKLAKREDFFGDVVDDYLKTHREGNYKRRPFETELKTLGVAINVSDMDGRRYEVLEWSGFESAHTMREIGFDIPDDLMNGGVEVDIWILDEKVIKADLNPWPQLVPEMDVKQYHQFVYEKDDTSITGNGLPNVIRDSQMSVASAARMVLDNAGIVCGPNLEVNTALLRMDQDLNSITPYKIWYREDDLATAQYPAVREISIQSHVDELTKVVQLFKSFADEESFINPATGGDIQKMPSEPFRNAAGASMIRGDLALPFKDAVRNFDQFTISVITSLIAFSRAFDPKPETEGDYNPIARGSTSLIAKEVRGMQLDQLAVTLQPDEKIYVKNYDLVRERFAVRDLPMDILVTKDEAEAIEEKQQLSQQQQQDVQDKLLEATVRKLLSEVLKNITQGDKNQATATATQAKAIMEVLERGLSDSSGDGSADSGAAPNKAKPPGAGPASAD